MKRKYGRWVVALTAIALFAAACGDSGESSSTTTKAASGASTTAGGPAATVKNTASDTGVTETSIKIAIHGADLSGLVKAGAITGVPGDAAEGNALRISYYLDKWNAEGGINGRKFEYQLITWDPADPKSYQTSCQKIIDAKVFMVISAGGGFPPDSTPCITVDGKTQYMGIDSVSAKQFKDQLGNFINLAPPGAASAAAGIEAIAKDAATLPKTAKVAVLRSDWDFATEAYNEVDKVLKRDGFNVVYNEAIKVANLPTADANKNVSLAVEKVKAAGATHVVNMLNFTNFRGFPPEATKAGLTLKYMILEISSGMCTAFSAGQLPAEMDGAPCYTHWNNFRIDTDAKKATDTPFEAQCRADFEATYKTNPISKAEATKFPPITKTTPGVPYPGLTDGQGKRLDMDASYYECNLMNIVKVGLRGAGGNLTKKTFQDAIFKQGTFDAAGIAGGKGSLAANKLWLADSIQKVVVTAIPVTDFAKQTADANGIYGTAPKQCLSPLSCYRTVPGSVTALTYKLS